MTIRTTLSVLSMLALGACASSPPPDTGGGGPFGDPDEGTIQIIVRNLNFSEARLYAVRRGSRSMLGIVGGKSDGEFQLDWDIPEPLQIEIHLIAGPTCTTQQLLTDPGDIIELQIESDFRATRSCG